MRLRASIAAAATVGLAIAAYLTVVHYAHSSPICTSGGCEKVQHSSYAKLAGLPVALLGVFAYVAIIGSAAWRGVEGALTGCVVALSGAAFSAYLLWAQIARIHAICVWCVGSDLVMGCLVVLCAARLLREPG